MPEPNGKMESVVNEPLEIKVFKIEQNHDKM
jgi:hypothetical protein